MKYLLLLLLFFLQNVSSLEMYRYKDISGNWAFSDKKPHQAKELIKTIIKERRKYSLTVKVEKFKTSHGVVYKARNELYAPVEFVFKNVRKKNIKFDRDITKSQVLPADSVVTILKVTQKVEKKTWSFSFSYKLNVGDPNNKAKDDFVYGVPFAKGTKYFIGQAFNGKFSHHDIYNRYAVDISTPVGTHILAARSGRVIDVAFGNYKAGVSQEYADKANVIKVLHKDGSIATYAHLKWEGIRVRAGDLVQKGEYIGDSGNTGFSTGPHLHFVIHANRKMGLESIPFKFSKKMGTSVTPLSRSWLKSE